LDFLSLTIEIHRNKLFTNTFLKILSHISKNPTATAVQMAEMLGVKARQCERILAAMKKKGLIERVGANKNGFWKICK
jgi:predicted HTH transcriptional regulator